MPKYRVSAGHVLNPEVFVTAFTVRRHLPDKVFPLRDAGDIALVVIPRQFECEEAEYDFPILNDFPEAGCGLLMVCSSYDDFHKT